MARFVSAATAMTSRIGSLYAVIACFCAACSLDGRGTGGAEGSAGDGRGDAAALATRNGLATGGDAGAGGETASSSINEAGATIAEGGNSSGQAGSTQDGASSQSAAGSDSSSSAPAGVDGSAAAGLIDSAPLSSADEDGSCAPNGKSNSRCDAAANPSCPSDNHPCAAGCTDDQQCSKNGTTPICDVSTGTCVGCVSGADCPTSKSLCHPVTQQCVQCLGDADCAGTSTPVCVQNHCAACPANANCAN